MKFKQVLVDSGQIRPRRRNVFYALRRETNLKCLLLTILIAGSAVAAFLLCPSSQHHCKLQSPGCEEETHSDQGLVIIPSAFILTLYLLYLVECWHSKAREMISRHNKVDVHTLYWKIEGMRRARPVVSWKALCFHFVNRAQHVSRMKDGKVYTCWKKVCERVNTHQVTCAFFAESCGWKDISRDLIDLERHTVTKVHFHKNFIFANSIARQEFQRQRELFAQDLVGLDDYIETSEALDLAGVTFPTDVTCWNQPDDLPWFARVHSFWILSALLLSWPMRIILELNTAHVHYHVTKLFGTNYEPEIPRPSPLSSSHNIPVTGQSYSSVSRLALKGEESGEISEKEALLEKWKIESPAPRNKMWKCLLESESEKPMTWSNYGTGITRSVTLLLPQPSYLVSSGVQRRWECFRSTVVDSMQSASERLQRSDFFPELVPSYSEALLLNGVSNDEISYGGGSQCSFAPVSKHADVRFESSSFRDEVNFPPSRTTTHATSSDVNSTWGNASFANFPGTFTTERDADSCYCENGGSVRSGEIAEGKEPPPDYFQALETSRPVWLPFWTSLRRCQTERDVSGALRLPSLYDIRPTFLRHFKNPRNNPTNHKGGS
ncbi:unnamed protein product [Allacma fusca]|uniref:Transmembrane protein 151B n=1 Tax=Allacma fusca TaxID=39272 RepID=A0A8J2K9A8_9HEXA|nr:unnamed protein product [Allacma fusca]